MRVVLAGGSGFLGGALTRRLLADGHGVTVLSRRPDARIDGAQVVTWDPDGTSGDWARSIEGGDALVNLSGAGIADARWTDERKAELRSSRVLSTRSLVAALRDAPRRPAVFIQQTGVGYYGASLSDRPLDESFPPGDDFLGELGVAWEAEALPASALGVRVVIVRSGLVLARDGSALVRMRPFYRWFVGGPVGSGRQYFAWIHLDDWLALTVWALTNSSVSGVLNGTAPGTITCREFSDAFGRALRRPSWLPVPGFVLRLLYGEMAAAVLLKGQRVVPRRTQELGFTFRYPTIDEALREVEGRPVV
jgi:uncharacterized protein (TIGR01777 family)